MNLVFISPNFPEYYYNFCSRLKDRGVNVLGIGDAAYNEISEDTKNSVTEYYRVNSLEDYEEVYRAVAFYTGKYGKIDWIESENEYWLELEATLRSDFNVTTGTKIKDLGSLRFKSKMKDVYKQAGIPFAKYTKVTSLKDSLSFIKEVGYPVIVKPDNGVGATHTYKIMNKSSFESFYKERDPKIPYIIEDYLPGHVETFDGITDKDKNILICTSHVMINSIMDNVNESADTAFYSQPVKESDIYEIGKKAVTAFDTRSRFYHFEFIRLEEDKKGVGKKGDLVGLEVNMRAPGAYIPDMMNLCYDVDIYTIWADMILYNECYYDIKRKYYVAYCGRHNSTQYALSAQDVYDEFHDEICIETDVPEVMAEAMGDHVYIYRCKTKTEMEVIMENILKHKETPVQETVAVEKEVASIKVESIQEETPKKKTSPKKKPAKKAPVKKAETVDEKPVKKAAAKKATAKKTKIVAKETKAAEEKPMKKVTAKKAEPVKKTQPAVKETKTVEDKPVIKETPKIAIKETKPEAVPEVNETSAIKDVPHKEELEMSYKLKQLKKKNKKKSKKRK